MNDESLINAIKSNDIALVAQLIANGSADVNGLSRVFKKKTVLFLAAKLGRVEIVALLLDAGARIDDVDVVGDSACHAAVRAGHADVVELLVARRADVLLKNQFHETPIVVAAIKKNESLLMMLIDAAMATGTPTPLDDDAALCAATVGTDVIGFLLKHQVNLSAICDRDGRTPLHHAVWRSSSAAVLKMLVEVAGVDIDARDQNGCTVAHIACMACSADTLSFAIAAGADLELPDINGETPLHYNLFHLACPIGILLLAAGANVHARNNRGRTPCHNACVGWPAVVPALLAFGANLDAPDNDGVTPRQLLTESPPPTSEEVEAARRRVVNVQLSFVRRRAFDVCVGLCALNVDALCMCEILIHSCGPFAASVPFHIWWQIATTVKHFHER